MLALPRARVALVIIEERPKTTRRTQSHSKAPDRTMPAAAASRRGWSWRRLTAAPVTITCRKSEWNQITRARLQSQHGIIETYRSSRCYRRCLDRTVLLNASAVPVAVYNLHYNTTTCSDRVCSWLHGCMGYRGHADWMEIVRRTRWAMPIINHRTEVISIAKKSN